MKETVRNYVTCPRCQNAELLFKEVTEAVETWAQDADGKITETDETGALLGRVIRVEAECRDPKCGHKWTVRRVEAVTDLPNWPKEEKATEVNDEPEEAVQAEAAPETNEGEVAEGQAEAEAAPAQPEAAAEPVKKRGGRPKGSKNKDKKAA